MTTLTVPYGILHRPRPARRAYNRVPDVALLTLLVLLVLAALAWAATTATITLARVMGQKFDISVVLTGSASGIDLSIN
ncbi:MAG: hypothetical protein EXQ85_09600 [Alphaproteobacteria bacterium]|nr:hypothetical protein [Alphaproteobacteria bacterium]